MFAFITFIPGAVLTSHLNIDSDTALIFDDINDAASVTNDGAVWIVIVCWAAMLWLTAVIIIRFLNLAIIDHYIGVALIFVSDLIPACVQKQYS